jgi:hypothetical protein
VNVQLVTVSDVVALSEEKFRQIAPPRILPEIELQ